MLRDQLEELSNEELKERYDTLREEATKLEWIVEETVMDVVVEILDILYLRNARVF